MNLFIYLFIYLFVGSIHQEKKVAHLLFDEASNKSYTYREGKQNYTLQYYVKYNRGNTYEFSIKGESFAVKKEDITDTCKITVLNKIRFSTIEELQKESNRNKWTFKSNIYDAIYVYEKINKNKAVKHKVRWMYVEY